MVARCLRRQDFNQDFEWLIASPENLFADIEKDLVNYNVPHKLFSDPPKKEGDFYSLNSAWNKLYSKAKGDLIVNIVDLIWFEPDALSRLWSHYQTNPKGLVSAIGHQYAREVEGKPQDQIWTDPRINNSEKSFFEVMPSEMEMCLCSIPRQAILDCGGLDEIYDKGAALGEKEMCWRLKLLDYKFFIDKTIEYRALHHPRLSENWDEMYKITSEIFRKHYAEMQTGTRTLNVNSLTIKG